MIPLVKGKCKPVNKKGAHALTGMDPLTKGII